MRLNNELAHKDQQISELTNKLANAEVSEVLSGFIYL